MLETSKRKITNVVKEYKEDYRIRSLSLPITNVCLFTDVKA
jgi:hypothetical protein